MIPHEDEPEGDSEELVPGEVDEVSESLKALETKLTRILKHANTEMGLYAIDLIEALHKVMGKVISWGMLEQQSEEDPEDEPEVDPEVEPKGPTSDGVITPDWTPASDVDSEDDAPDVEDDGDPLLPV